MGTRNPPKGGALSVITADYMDDSPLAPRFAMAQPRPADSPHLSGRRATRHRGTDGVFKQ